MHGPHRLHDQVLKLEQIRRSLISWRFVETDAILPIDEDGIGRSKSGHKINPTRDTLSPTAEWQSELSFTIRLPSDITPTFCSAIAARQYSLIILLKATGVCVKNFLLEVPIQVVSAPLCLYSSDLLDEFSELSELDDPYRRSQNTHEVLQEDSGPPPKYM